MLAYSLDNPGYSHADQVTFIKDGSMGILLYHDGPTLYALQIANTFPPKYLPMIFQAEGFIVPQ
jgi:hypothetical protein